MIEKDVLNETDLIVGGFFPAENEDEYRAEAAAHREKSQVAADAMATMAASADYTADEVRGRFGAAASDMFRSDQLDFSRAADGQTAIASVLDRMADEISRAKNEINNIQHSYHDRFTQTMGTAVGEGWDQPTLRAEKAKMVEQAQQDVRSASAGLKQFLSSSMDEVSSTIAMM